VNRGDQLIEKGAARLYQLSQEMVARGGIYEKVGRELVEDAVFLRQLKPSLIVARARGEAPTSQEPGAPVVAPSGPQVGKPPKPPGAGPNPFLVVGIALAAGIALAKLIDWRGHAHPRDN
jgi:hypothetical protein